MIIAPHIKEQLAGSSLIRKMFEEGIALKAEFGADNVYDFSLGNPDLEPPKKVKDVLKSLAESPEKGMHSYMPNAGYKQTREAMAKKVSLEQGVAIDFNTVIMACGAAGAINSLFKAVLSPQDVVLVPTPYFAEYGHYVRNYGGTLIPVQSNEDFSLNIGGIQEALKTHPVKAIIINSPNNPSGKIYTPQEIQQLAQVLQEHQDTTGKTVLIVADEPYRDIVYDGHSVAPLFPYWKASVIASSFAKNLSLPGERIGYIAINSECPEVKELVDAIIFSTRILGFVNAPASFQRVVAASWDAPVDYSLYVTRRSDLSAILDEAGIEYYKPEGAFYMFCKVPAKTSASDLTKALDGEFCNHLKKYNILAVPGSGFGQANWFRLAYCVDPNMILRSCAAFKKAVQDWQ